MIDPAGPHARKLYTVSELTADIRRLLEERFAFVWLSGEISNFRRPASGHCYFTLKDDSAQIQAVMFRGPSRSLKFDIEDGLEVTGLGRITVYPPRGVYQIIFEYMEPKGVGALQVAFEQLKARLAREGLFAAEHKKDIPLLPARISLITSPSGAAVRDMIQVIRRRHDGVRLRVVPVQVQGESAADEIVAALDWVNRDASSDVAILARGGGSLEDLAAFNTESVARALFASEIPVISAVGHETDYTIADFVADLRAPTPSAAAELVVPMQSELRRRVAELQLRMEGIITQDIEIKEKYLSSLVRHLTDPRRTLGEMRIRLDDHVGRLMRGMENHAKHAKERLLWYKHILYRYSPEVYLNKARSEIENIEYKLINSFEIFFKDKIAALRALNAQLNALSPRAILARGYSITRTLPQAAVVTDADTVNLEQNLEVILARGALTCRVKGKRTDGEEDV